MYKAAIPYFHSIQPEPDLSWRRNFLTIKVAVFEQFLCYLKKNSWETIFLDEMYDLKKSGFRRKGKYCVITFDDGYLDNYTYAYPLLKEYGMKGTIFISPDCVDIKRPKSERDTHKNHLVSGIESHSTAYLNWDEIREMQASGIIDIQSHTMTHTKYFCSDKIASFHHPVDDCIYATINEFPEYRSNYFRVKDFEKLLPYGTPFFVAKSAVVSKIHYVNAEFNAEISKQLSKQISSGDYDFSSLLKIINPTYQSFLKQRKVIVEIESEADFIKRITYEIAGSKKVIEEKLGKPVEFLCWPHGENNALAHQIAMDSGYKATSVGKSGANSARLDRYDRFGVSDKASKFISIFKWRYKLNSSIGLFPESQIRSWYEGIRYGVK